jgi:HSP20 family protein
MLVTSLDPFLADFDRLVRRAFGWQGGGSGPWAGMPMDAIRREDGVELKFDLPGIDAESIDVTVDNGVLSVSATRDEELTEQDKPYIRERVTGQFTRRIRLSDNIDTDKIEAAYRDGVLKLWVPLAQAAKPRKIEITHGAQKELTS